MNVELTREEILRYSRHLILPEVGIDGQKKIKSSKVLVVGSGGLGSPSLLYLAAAGVGRLGVVDFDRVDETNLQRQIIHSVSEVGKPKVESAKKRILDLNPMVDVKTYNTLLTKDNAKDIISGFDVVVDGTDNFPTRYLLSDMCVWLKKPLVYASIFRFEGMVTVFDASKGPCYRCLFPTPPPPGEVPSCAEGGVLGVLPGVIGTIQALEALKIILGRGDVLIGRLLIFSALDMRFHEVELKKDDGCPVCGKNPTIFEPVDYVGFCGSGVGEDIKETEFDITPQELKRMLDDGKNFELLDVRLPEEKKIADIGGRLIPVQELPARLHELDSSKEYVVYCKSGGRSLRAVELLRRIGFTKVKNLRGGINAYSKEVDSSIPLY